jgi:hypothetical protein
VLIFLFFIVLESPVTRPQKDRDRTGLRPQKTGPPVSVFQFQK